VKSTTQYDIHYCTRRIGRVFKFFPGAPANKDILFTNSYLDAQIAYNQLITYR
jgi:hypothetical protein